MKKYLAIFLLCLIPVIVFGQSQKGAGSGYKGRGLNLSDPITITGLLTLEGGLTITGVVVTINVAVTINSTLVVAIDDATNTGVTNPLKITHTTSGVPGAGIGVGIELEAETSASNNEILAIIDVIASDAGAGTEDGDLRFLTMTGGAAATEKMRIDGDGNVGIGTASPTHNLEVINPDGVLSVRFDGNSVSNNNVIHFGDGTGGDNDFRFTFRPNNIVSFLSGRNNMQIRFGYDNTSNSSANLQFGYFNTGGGNISFLQANAVVMRIASDGNVGIGTTSPSEPLELFSSSVATGIGIDGATNADSFIRFRENTVAKADFFYDASEDFFVFRGASGQGLRFITNLDAPTAPNFQIDSGGDLRWSGDSETNMLYGDASEGRVGIGTASPEALLHISSGDILLDNNNFYRAKDAGGTPRAVFWVDTGDDVNFGALNLDDIKFDVGGVDNAVIIKQTTGNIEIGAATAIDTQSPDMIITGDADSDGAAVTTEALTIALTPASDPTTATWDITSTQSAGYTFDKAVTVTGTLNATTLQQGGSGVVVAASPAFTGSPTLSTNVIWTHVALSGATDNTATNFFTVTTTDETGSADGGSYSVHIELTVNEAGAASGATNTAMKSWEGHFGRIMASAGTGANTSLAETSESDSANEGTGNITTVTMTIVETSEFIQTIQLLVDTSGGTFDGFAIIRLVYTDFTTAPVVAGI